MKLATKSFQITDPVLIRRINAHAQRRGLKTGQEARMLLGEALARREEGTALGSTN